MLLHHAATRWSASLQTAWVFLARRAGLMFAAATILTSAITLLLLDSRGAPAPGTNGRYTDDLAGYVAWTRLVTLGGIQDAYHGTFIDTYSVYGPVILYGYQAVGTGYRLLVDPTYDSQQAEDNVWPVRGIKLTALIWHLLTAAAIYLFARRLAGPILGALAAAFYVVNPVALFDVARWGQPDGAHSLFAVLTIGFLGVGAPVWAWAVLPLGALAKPQGLLIVPLVVVATLQLYGWGRLLKGVAVAAAVTAVVLLPFALTGRAGDLLGLPSMIASVQPSVTADAYNVWWLTFGLSGVLDPQSVLDTTAVVGPLTYRMIAGGLVALNFILVIWLYWSRRVELAEAAALSVLGWFLVTTQAHENHPFVALPLLALAWPRRPRLLVVFALLTLTILVNMLALSALTPLIGGLASGRVLAAVRDVTAIVNVVCFVAWSLAAAFRRPAPTSIQGTPGHGPALFDNSPHNTVRTVGIGNGIPQR